MQHFFYVTWYQRRSENPIKFLWWNYFLKKFHHTCSAGYWMHFWTQPCCNSFNETTDLNKKIVLTILPKKWFLKVMGKVLKSLIQISISCRCCFLQMKDNMTILTKKASILFCVIASLHWIGVPYSLAVADELLECVWPLCGLTLKELTIPHNWKVFVLKS